MDSRLSLAHQENDTVYCGCYLDGAVHSYGWLEIWIVVELRPRMTGVRAQGPVCDGKVY